MRTIYVAGSSQEMERAEGWMVKLTEAGIRVISTWPKIIRESEEKLGKGLIHAANPMDATHDERAAMATVPLLQVSQADAFWLLLPTKPTVGAYVELGYSLALQAMSQIMVENGHLAQPRFAICSGVEKSIFTALAMHFVTDEEAFAFLTAKPEESTEPAS